jgi:Neutral/alkaline non-lysosomal ceramidase, N-terminal
VHTPQSDISPVGEAGPVDEASPELRAGFARADITPTWPVSLAGFASRSGLSTGVAHPLHVRAAVFEAGGGAIVVSADLLYWPPELVEELRPLLAAQTDVPADHILFAATHTHSAPQVCTWLAPSVGVRDEKSVDLVRRQTVQAVSEAAARLEPVTVRRATGQHDLGMNRRTVVDGRAHAAPNPAGPRDPDVTVVTYLRDDGGLAGAITHYTCHPVISADSEVSGDFSGEAMRLIEEETGAVSLYLQGCCGDINPGRVACTGLAEVDRQAAAFADVLRQVLAGPAETLEPTRLGAEWRREWLPFRGVPDQAGIAAACTMDGVQGEWGRALHDHPELVADTAGLLVQRLDLARGLHLVAMNGEVSVAYGLAIKEMSQQRALPVAYANGTIGYLPTAAQIAEGGYEAEESARYLLLPGYYAPEIEGMITTATQEVIGTVCQP